MGPVDNFIHSLNTILKSDTADKTSQIAAVMSRCEEVFKGYQAAPKAQELRELADRIAPISRQDAETLRAYADEILFPKELTLRLIKEMGDGLKLGNVRLASKEMRQMVLQSLPQAPLREMGIFEARNTIQFAKFFGPDLTYLDISQISFSSSQIAELLSYLPNLKTLIAQHCDLAGVGVTALANAPTLKNLKKLDLVNNCIKAENAVTLIASPYLKNVEELSLGANALHDAGALTIASAFHNLKVLDLSYNHISSEGVVELVKCQNLSSLKSLRLSNNSVEEAGAKALATSPILANLQELALMGCQIGAEGIMALAASKTFTQLTRLNLRNNQVGDREIQAIANSKTFEQLELLELGEIGIGDAGLIAIAHSSILKNLRTLILSYCHIGDAGVAVLASSPHLTNLERLELTYNDIGDEGFSKIATTFSKLRELNLSGNEIKKDGTLALSALSHLEILNLANLRIGDTALAALVDSQPNLKSLNLYGNVVENLGAIAIATSPIPNIGFIPIGSFVKFAVAQRPKLLPLTQEQRQQLYRNICQIARESGATVEGAEEEWGKAHLFDDKERFARALAMTR